MTCWLQVCVEYCLFSQAVYFPSPVDVCTLYGRPDAFYWHRTCDLSVFVSFLSAETFGGETAEQGSRIQEETSGNVGAEKRVWGPSAHRGDSTAETRQCAAQAGDLNLKPPDQREYYDLWMSDVLVPGPLTPLLEQRSTLYCPIIRILWTTRI